MIIQIFRSNQLPFYQRLFIWLAIGLLIITWPGWARANGGTTIWVEQVGAYELLVSASPYPLEVGKNDISVLVGRLPDAQLVLDAEVVMTTEPIDHSGQPQTFAATHANATNKLYYAANVIFPTAGRWRLTVQVDGPGGMVSTAFETDVAPRSLLRFLTNLELTGLVIIVILVSLFLAAVLMLTASRTEVDE